jgi:glycosidase
MGDGINSPTYRFADSPIHQLRPHPHLLELSAWPWLERLSRDAGRRVTLATVPGKEWDRLTAEGFDALFLMGVWRRSAIGRSIALEDPGLVAAYNRALPGWRDADVAGSPYSVQAYEPDDRMGGWEGLDHARRELKRRGVALILDFVPNHTGFDHSWISAHPEWYVRGTSEDLRRAPTEFRQVGDGGSSVVIACGKDPHFPPWTDVAQLNYFNPETRRAMAATVREIAAYCDGVRCDMAMLVLNDVFERTWRGVLCDTWPVPGAEFWPETTASLREFIWLAEVYWDLEGRMLDQGFTFAYDKRLLDGLRAPDRARRVRDLLSAGSPPPHRLARFLENHDESRSIAGLAEHLSAAVALLVALPGMRFIFDGQMDGRHTAVPVQLGRWPDEGRNEVVRILYERALAFGQTDVLHEGEWKLVAISAAGDHTCANIVAYRWRSAGALAVVAVNLGDASSQAHLALADDLPPGVSFDLRDALTDITYRRTRESLIHPGLYVRLERGQAHLFAVHLSSLE